MEPRAKELREALSKLDLLPEGPTHNRGGGGKLLHNGMMVPLLSPIPFEFSLNDFGWIQWKMSKSKGGMVTRDTPQLITDTFPEAVGKIKFPKLHLVR